MTLKYKENSVNYLIIEGRLVLLSGTLKGEYLKYFPYFDIPQTSPKQKTGTTNPKSIFYFFFFYFSLLILEPFHKPEEGHQKRGNGPSLGRW